MDVAIYALNRMLEFGSPISVRVAWPQSGAEITATTCLPVQLGSSEQSGAGQSSPDLSTAVSVAIRSGEARLAGRSSVSSSGMPCGVFPVGFWSGLAPAAVTSVWISGWFMARQHVGSARGESARRGVSRPRSACPLSATRLTLKCGWPHPAAARRRSPRRSGCPAGRSTMLPSRRS